MPEIGTYEPDSGKITLGNQEEKILVDRLNSQYEATLTETSRSWNKSEIIKNYLAGNQVEGRNDFATIERRLASVALATEGNVDEEHFVDNMMVRIHMSNMHRLTRLFPQIEISPNSRAVEDKNACRLGRLALYDLLDKVGFKQLKKKTGRVICIFGHVYGKVWYDPTAGEMTHQPVLGDDGGIIGYSDEGDAPGEVVWDIVSPKNITLPLYSTGLDTLDWLQESNIRTVDYILRKYNITVKGQSLYSKDMERFRKERSSESTDSQERDKAPQNYALVHEVYMERTPEFPKGAIVTFTGKKILAAKTLYDFYSRIPYRKAEFIFDEESLGGDTPYWHLIPYQDALNETEADIRRHVVMMCQPKYLVPTESMVKDDDIDNGTARILRFQGQVPPSLLSPTSLPATVTEWVGLLIERMLAMAAAHDIVQGTAGSDQSGNAIAYRQQQDDSTLAPVIESIQSMFEDMMKMSLECMARWYTIPRLVKITDGRKVTVEEAFKGEMLKNNFDVHLSLTNGMPYNQLAKQQYIMQLVDKGVLSAEEARGFLEFGNVDEVMQLVQVGVECAEKTVKDLEDGKPVVFHMWDDHVTIVKYLLMAMRERYEEWTPNIRQDFERQLQMHQNFLAMTAHPGGQMAGPVPEQMDGSQPPAPVNPGLASPTEAPEAGPSTSNQDASDQPDRSTVIPPAAGAPQNI